MNQLIRDFVRDLIDVVELPDPVVEFGSLHVEAGQDTDLRPLFPGRDYLGTDMREGPGVDRVEDLMALSLEDGSVGTAICLETLEHTQDPPQACRELTRVVGDNGVLIVTAPMLLGQHAYPDDYFRFMPSSFKAMLSGFDDVWVHGLGSPEIPNWVLGVAAKRKLDLSIDRLPRTAAHQARFEAARGRFRIGYERVTAKQLVKEAVTQLPRVVRERIADRRRGK